jgi:hypothetical protein
MYDLTGANFTGYMIRLCRDIASRNPRYSANMGQTLQMSDNRILFGDVEVIISDVSSDGRRLSPDYFMYTQLGKAIVAKLEGKDGQFIEWANEVDPTGQLLDPGVYNINVDWVKDTLAPAANVPPTAKTGDVGFTLEKYKWRQGTIEDAQGSIVGFADGIDATTVTPINPATGQPIPCQAAQSSLQLLASTSTLAVHTASGVPLVPNQDFWIERVTTEVLIPSTIFGMQDATIPTGFLSLAILDSDDYALRPNIDYIMTSATTIRLSAWTPANTTISALGLRKFDPTVPGNCISPENTLNFQLLSGETLVPDQVFISTQDGTNIPVTVNSDGTVTLQTPLPAGGSCNYEVRISVGRSFYLGKRGSVTTSMIPGLWVAIGDKVVPGDQCCILISPTTTETYQVYGSQEGITATINVKANDNQTASDLAEMIRQGILVNRRLTMESDGITPGEMSKSHSEGTRDASGTSATHTWSLGFTALGEWRVFKPMVTRITNFNVTSVPQTTPYPRKIQTTPRFWALGMSGFLPDYR